MAKPGIVKHGTPNLEKKTPDHMEFYTKKKVYIYNDVACRNHQII